MIIDTHCHLIDEAFTSDVEACVVHAQEAGVEKIMQACCDEKEFLQILALSKRYPERLYSSIGIHPENLAEDIDPQLDTIEKLLKEHRQEIKAVGEIGLDLYWDKSRIDDQRTALTRQMLLAADYDMPVLLHIREAMPEFLDLLKHTIYNKVKEQGKEVRGILHCYSGTAEEAAEVLQYGDFLFGIGGTLTYKKSKVPEVAKAIGLERIVLETDAPYLAPIPHRGKRNEPAYTRLTALFLAELLEVPLEVVEQTTTTNAIRMLGL